MSEISQEKRKKVDEIRRSILGEGDLKEEIRTHLQDLGEEWDLINSAIKELRADVKNTSLSDKQKKRIREADDALMEVQYEEWGSREDKM